MKERPVGKWTVETTGGCQVVTEYQPKPKAGTPVYCPRDQRWERVKRVVDAWS